MVRPFFSLAGVRGLEASLRVGLRRLSDDVFEFMARDLAEIGKEVADTVQNSQGFKDLKTNDSLRGKLGLPLPSRRTGGDTDEEDLLRELKNFKITKRRNQRFKTFGITFPSLTELQTKLVVVFTSEGVTGLAGPTNSWFRWWEFGDRGEIDTFTLLRETIARFVATTDSSRRAGTRRSTLELIERKSRSGTALQIKGIRAGIESHITGRQVVTTTYLRFGNNFAKRMQKTLRRYVLTRARNVPRLFPRVSFA